MAMTPAVQSMVAATYVRDIDTSRAFYELLGFHEQSAGRADASAWSALWQGGHHVLLASTRPPLDIPRLPLLFYFFFDDVDAVVGVLHAASVDVAHMGYPPHALGSEVKVADPDGNTVLLGQPQRSASQPAAGDAASPRFSLLKEAAAVVRARRQPGRLRGQRPGRDAVPEPGRREARRYRRALGVGLRRPRRRDPADRARGVHRRRKRPGNRRVRVPRRLAARRRLRWAIFARLVHWRLLRGTSFAGRAALPAAYPPVFGAGS